MSTILGLCSRPFVDVWKHISDYPVRMSVFAGFLAGVLTQSVMIGSITLGGCAVFLSLLYIVTRGRAFGRGGLKQSYTSKHYAF